MMMMTYEYKLTVEPVDSGSIWRAIIMMAAVADDLCRCSLLLLLFVYGNVGPFLTGCFDSYETIVTHPADGAMLFWSFAFVFLFVTL